MEFLGSTSKRRHFAGIALSELVLLSKLFPLDGIALNELVSVSCSKNLQGAPIQLLVASSVLAFDEYFILDSLGPLFF